MTPWLAVVLMVLGDALAFSEYRMIMLLTLGIFGLSAFSILLFLNRDIGKSVGIFRLGQAAARYGVLILASLLTLSRHPAHQVPRGGKP